MAQLRRKDVNRHFSSEELEVFFQSPDILVILDKRERPKGKVRRFASFWKLPEKKDKRIAKCIDAVREWHGEHIKHIDKAPVGHLRIAKNVAKLVGLEMPKRSKCR